MRRDLVQRVLVSAQGRLFEDVAVQVGNAVPETRAKAIFGIVPAAARFEELGTSMRATTQVTRAIKSALPGLAKGNILITEEGRFRVVDIEPIGDGRFEIVIALDKVG